MIYLPQARGPEVGRDFAKNGEQQTSIILSETKEPSDQPRLREIRKLAFPYFY